MVTMAISKLVESDQSSALKILHDPFLFMDRDELTVAIQRIDVFTIVANRQDLFEPFLRVSIRARNFRIWQRSR